MKSVIFDLDGTLWDASLPIAEAWREVGRRYFGPSFSLPLEKVCAMMGKTMDEIARLLVPENADLAAFSGFVHDSFSYECEYLSSHPGSLFPGELDVLKELSQKYDLYIVSNAQAGYIENFTAILPYPYIKDHMCWDDTKKEKAVTIQALMARHSIAKEDAVYVGDTSKDRDAAFGAGIPFIYCLFGFEKKPREDEPTLRAFQELPAALERIFKGN